MYVAEIKYIHVYASTQQRNSKVSTRVETILPRITNKMQRYTIFFIAVSALHVSGGFSANHQELKIQNYTYSIWYVLSCNYIIQ
jgi:hypothetical protein